MMWPMIGFISIETEKKCKHLSNFTASTLIVSDKINRRSWFPKPT